MIKIEIRHMINGLVADLEISDRPSCMRRRRVASELK